MSRAEGTGMLLEVEAIWLGEEQEEYTARDTDGKISIKYRPIVMRAPRLINHGLVLEVIPDVISRPNDEIIPINTIRFLDGSIVNVSNPFKYLRYGGTTGEPC